MKKQVEASSYTTPRDTTSPVHGDQEGAAWNGHFQSKCLHPLFVFNQFGDLERCALRPGNVHSADSWEDVLRPVLTRYSAEVRPSITRRRFRGQSGACFAAMSKRRQPLSKCEACSRLTSEKEMQDASGVRPTTLSRKSGRIAAY